MTVNIEHIVIGPEGYERIILASKSGDIGYCGPGQTIDIRSRTTGDGSPWNFDVPVPEQDGDLRVRVLLNNVRNLEDKEVERLVAQLTIIGAEVAAGALVHGATKGAEIALAVFFGLTGFGLDKVVEDIFKDPPNCVGLVYDEDVSISPDSLDKLPYNATAPTPQGYFYSEKYSLSFPQSGLRPGTSCGTFSGRVRYEVVRTVPYPPFGSTPKVDKRHLELDSIDPKQMSGSWADYPSSSSARPNVVLWIRPTGTPWQDGFDIDIREKHYADDGRVMEILVASHTGMQLEKSSVMVPRKKNVFGEPEFVPNPLLDLNGGGILKFHPETIALADRLQRRSAVSTAGSMVGFKGGGYSPVFDPEFEQAEQARVAAEINAIQYVRELNLPDFSGFDLASYFKTTMSISLPGGVQLSFWQELLQEGSVVRSSGVVMRYTRWPDSRATLTDTWMAHYTPVK